MTKGVFVRKRQDETCQVPDRDKDAVRYVDALLRLQTGSQFNNREKRNGGLLNCLNEGLIG